MKIEQGQIWEVVTDGLQSSGKAHKLKRKITLGNGEKIEIRYPFEWHYRTEDDIYLHVAPEEILKHCRLFGVIDPKINWENKKKLNEILEEKLYEGWEI